MLQMILGEMGGWLAYLKMTEKFRKLATKRARL
jgi:hypothetical protein